MQVSELSATQRQLEQHVEALFASPAWRASPRQCELADRLKARCPVAAILGCTRLLLLLLAVQLQPKAPGSVGMCGLVLQPFCVEAGAWYCRARGHWPVPDLQVLEGQASEAARGVGTYGRGTQLLGESNQLLAEAVQGLQQTQVGGAPLRRCKGEAAGALRCAAWAPIPRMHGLHGRLCVPQDGG